jgi:hypothetical protein
MLRTSAKPAFANARSDAVLSARGVADADVRVGRGEYELRDGCARSRAGRARGPCTRPRRSARRSRPRAELANGLRIVGKSATWYVCVAERPPGHRGDVAPHRLRPAIGARTSRHALGRRDARIARDDVRRVEPGVKRSGRSAAASGANRTCAGLPAARAGLGMTRLMLRCAAARSRGVSDYFV